MPPYDWSSFTKRITIKAKPHDIYRAFATQAGLEKWFLRLAEFTKPDLSHRGKDYQVQKGDTYHWLWFGYTDDVNENGKILEANGKDLLQFSFSGGSIVTVRIYTELTHVVAELKQEHIALTEESKVNYHLGCSTGWSFYLANLKSLLEGGIDLRNKDEAISDVVNS
jgi:uncharacterized protein YndB with AHSA1/START domain